LKKDEGENIRLINIERKYYAMGNFCTRETGPLAEGTLEGYEVEGP
jgi:nitrite reductase/ring-hydroxylating ferredoxin subunit